MILIIYVNPDIYYSSKFPYNFRSRPDMWNELPTFGPSLLFSASIRFDTLPAIKLTRIVWKAGTRTGRFGISRIPLV